MLYQWRSVVEVFEEAALKVGLNSAYYAYMYRCIVFYSYRRTVTNKEKKDDSSTQFRSRTFETAWKLIYTLNTSVKYVQCIVFVPKDGFRIQPACQTSENDDNAESICVQSPEPLHQQGRKLGKFNTSSKRTIQRCRASIPMICKLSKQACKRSHVKYHNQHVYAPIQSQRYMNTLEIDTFDFPYSFLFLIFSLIQTISLNYFLSL